MPPDESGQHPKSIRCESCGARYEDDDRLQGKEVECGECGQRFVVPVKRRYPGGKRDPLLDQVAKVQNPLPSGDFEASAKQQELRARFIQNESSSAKRSIAGAIAVIMIIITALILLPLLGRQIGVDLNLFYWVIWYPLQIVLSFFLSLGGVNFAG